MDEGADNTGRASHSQPRPEGHTSAVTLRPKYGHVPHPPTNPFKELIGDPVIFKGRMKKLLFTVVSKIHPHTTNTAIVIVKSPKIFSVYLFYGFPP